MIVPAYITKLEDVTCSGWVKVGDIWVSKEPLRDTSTGLYARLDWKDAVDACAIVGGRLVTADDIDACFAEADQGRALCLSPYNLPDAHLCAEAGVPLDWTHHAAEMEAFLTANMGGLAWAEYHDAKVQAALDALGWNGAELLVNVGKLWCSGLMYQGKFCVPPAGRAWLYGWRQANRHMIQPRPTPDSHGPHGAEDEHDYGTLTVVASDTEPAPIANDVAAASEAA